ncbi:MAG: polysaccharide deacetylase [Bdellovibrio sp. ArHS]|uniref:polysaccharide deacetylase family protein n=1 Tax=Bdellovibrio sp. ArHS TaxID=1569284 RepID=UPI000583A534|nr:polysaccharide deacetylase family protein [Bdellovibrio sp. ArHS]KHD89157.1 MAG: polysaccharide deacetylase [Bdellovibrio sp. ArHS]
MKNWIVKALAIGLAGTLVGCGNSISKKVQQAVTDNQQAQSNLEWEQSEAHPEALFEEWRQSETKGAPRENLPHEICESLAQLDALSLTLFENEIRDAQNEALLAGCKAELLSSIDSYFSSERQKLSVSVNALVPARTTNSFKFPTNVQKRDTSNGYYATYGDTARKEVILTFDDGPNNIYTPSILRSLNEVNAKAIFFALGKNSRLNPETLKLVASQGHAIGSHTETHSCIGNSSACRKMHGRNFTFDEAVEEIRKGHQAIYDVLGWIDPFFRFPYAEGSPQLRNFLKTSSTGDFSWVIDSEDWKAQSNDNVLRNTLNQVEAKGRGIILFHDIQRKTAEIMPTFLRELYTRGYSVVLLQSADPSARYNSKLVKKRVP